MVRTENGRTWIEGIPALGWEMGRDCTFAGCLEAATAPTEHPWQYSDLMGASGLAFRVRWSNPDLCGWEMSSPCGEFPEEYYALIDSTGWTMPCDFGGEQPDLDAIGRKIAASIDAGRAVLTHVEDHDISLIYGYADTGKTLMVRHRSDPEKPMVCPVDRIGEFQIYLGDHGEPAAERDSFVAALKMAVSHWTRGRADGGRPDKSYLYGEAALATWAKDLTSRDPMELSEEERLHFHALNDWNYLSLVDARRAAVSYLRDHVSCLSEKARGGITRAAELYAQEAKLLGDARRKGGVWADSSGKPVEQWSEQVRMKQSSLLVEARGLEDHAVREIERALVAEGAISEPKRGTRA